MDRINLAKNRGQRRVFVKTVMNTRVTEMLVNYYGTERLVDSQE
jgi:hypothetical protein